MVAVADFVAAVVEVVVAVENVVAADRAVVVAPVVDIEAAAVLERRILYYSAPFHADAS